MKVSAFFFYALLLFSLLIVRAVLELVWVKTTISKHIFFYDGDNYVLGENKIRRIKREVQMARMVQLNYAVEVDTKDPALSVLFDPEYGEDTVWKKYKEDKKKKDIQKKLKFPGKKEILKV